MAVGITKQDKQKAKNTVVILSVILILFTILSVLFGCLIPKAKEIKFLGNNEEIRQMIESKDGNEFFLLSDDGMYRIDTFTSEQKSAFALSQIRTMLEDNGDADKLLDGSLTQWKAKYVEGKDGQDYYLVLDGCGNIFKLKDDGLNLTTTNDYFLADSTTGKLDVKGFDNQDEVLYVLALDKDSVYNIYRFDADNLETGFDKKKQLWDLELEGATDTEQKIIPLTSAKTGVYKFVVADGYIYMFKNNGGLIRIGLSLADYEDENGVEYDYFKVVSDYHDQGRDKEVEQAAKDSYFRNLIKNHADNPFKDDELSALTGDTLKDEYQKLVSTKKFTDENKKANEYAKVAVNETFVAENPWCADYDSASRTLLINKSAIKSEFYSILNAGDCNVGGVIYSKDNHAVYYTNLLDNHLYCVEKTAIDNAESGTFLSDLATKITSIDIGDKQLSTFGNALSWNKYANTLYLRFQNDRTIMIVDINDKNDYKILYSFQADFDVNSLTGDKDNKVTNVIRQVTSVDLDATTNNYLYSSTYEPEKFENKGLTETLFVISLVIAIIVLLFDIWFFVAWRNERALYRLKEIQKDVKKNKMVYLALSFFIILLFMFCYYEAIGAISMSFFDYTQEKPSWIWNNFGHYIKILNDNAFWSSIGNMLFFLVFDLFLCIAPPLVFAFLLILIRNKVASNWVRSLMFIPSIIPSMATMLIWRTGIYGNDGLLNQLLGASEPIEFLTNTDYARWSLIMMGFPFVGGYLIFYGGLMNIPGEYHEAGRLEGLGIVKRFFMIDIPLIMPQIKYIFIMTFISSVQNYARTYILASTGTKTPVEEMYTTMMTYGDYGKSSAYATLIFLFLFAAVATNFKMQKKETMGEDL